MTPSGQRQPVAATHGQAQVEGVQAGQRAGAAVPAVVPRRAQRQPPTKRGRRRQREPGGRAGIGIQLGARWPQPLERQAEAAAGPEAAAGGHAEVHAAARAAAAEPVTVGERERDGSFRTGEVGQLRRAGGHDADVGLAGQRRQR
jgi:hypothetical protein